MGWNKDGSTIKALYLSEHIVRGTVIESRVKYGGTVSYWLKLENPTFIFGSLRETLMVDENDVIADFGVIENA
jgi:hypothetical protein